MNEAQRSECRVERLVMRIYCCGCGFDVEARLTDGKEIYPHRTDLFDLPFWRCDACGNFVGCHHKTKNMTSPLGCIPTPELKKARKKLHALIDPIWQSGKMGRRELYDAISREVGWKYHTAKTRTIEEARAAYRAAARLARRSGPDGYEVFMKYGIWPMITGQRYHIDCGGSVHEIWGLTPLKDIYGCDKCGTIIPISDTKTYEDCTS